MGNLPARMSWTSNSRAGERRGRVVLASLLGLVVSLVVAPAAFGVKHNSPKPNDFRVEEATIGDLQSAIKRNKVTTTEIVEAYLERVKAYNGTCVNEPDGIL